MKSVVQTDDAPQAIGPYSQAIVHHDIVYCSGQISLDAATMQIVGTDAGVQTSQIMENLKAVLHASGSDLSNVLKCSIYLANMDDFGSVNKVYGQYFPVDPPARETVAVKTLPKNALVEISCIAFVS